MYIRDELQRYIYFTMMSIDVSQILFGDEKNIKEIIVK